MSTCSCIGLSTMKPSCRILIACSSKRSTMFGYSISKCTHSTVNNLSKSQFKLHGNRLFHGRSSRILGFGGVVDSNGSYGKNVGYRSSVIDLSRKGFCGSDLNWRQPKVFINGCHVGGVGRCGRGVVKVASNFRNQSTSSVESHVSEKSWEKIYIQQGGFNVKPLVIEKIDSGSDVEEEKKVEVNADNLKGLNGSKLLTSERMLSEIEKEAWDLLQGSVVNYCGNPIGTVAACDPIDNIPLNYDQVFIRDFVPSALAFLLNGEGEIVKNFLLHTLQLQSWEKTVDCHSPGQGLMPASFKVRNIPLDGKPGEFEDVLDPDFGESAIGRVAPVDSGLWWIILLRSYGKITGDYSLQERVDV